MGNCLSTQVGSYLGTASAALTPSAWALWSPESRPQACQAQPGVPGPPPDASPHPDAPAADGPAQEGERDIQLAGPCRSPEVLGATWPRPKRTLKPKPRPGQAPQPPRSRNQRSLWVTPRLRGRLPSVWRRRPDPQARLSHWALRWRARAKMRLDALLELDGLPPDPSRALRRPFTRASAFQPVWTRDGHGPNARPFVPCPGPLMTASERQDLGPPASIPARRPTAPRPQTPPPLPTPPATSPAPRDSGDSGDSGSRPA
ncbi:proline-rich protein HaeIII subfamily 1-like [Erinaceus europaeus]|uniref:Proline-rich protein HaeIII subfamily 1-like n=1 Tax=Erinaceus europaeus TaxID=9365 RepID=A0ABM3WQ25_ERIEU|nr:proline-rich protein HaeIII subfamily 1-like [Erinaceus europaeus]